MADTAILTAEAAAAEATAQKTAGRGEGGCFLANSGKGSPFMVSGELFLRSTQELLFSGGVPSSSDRTQHLHPKQQQQQQRDDAPAAAPAAAGTAAASPSSAAAATNNHPSAGLLAGLSPDLRHLLLCHPDVAEAGVGDGGGAGGGAGGAGLLGLVSRAREERRAVRRKRVGYLETSKTMAGCLATARLSAARKAKEGFRDRYAEGRARLDARLRGLVLK